jgi:hypothetical protein
VQSPSNGALLLARQAALQAEAGEVITELGLPALFADVGPVLLTGSYVSGLMCWRELDVMLLAAPHFSPHDVLQLLHRVIDLPNVAGFDYRDERGPRCPTGQASDERYHVPFRLWRPTGSWRIDLSVWLNDPHAHVTAWHEALRERISSQQRVAILQIKDVWHRLPSYPDEVGGREIYTAVLDDGARSPEDFRQWLTDHGLPAS